MLQQREGLLAEKLQVRDPALDHALVVRCAEPVFRIEEVVCKTRRVLAIPVELCPKIEEPTRPIPDGEAARPAGFRARLCNERADRGVGDRIVGSFQKLQVGASAPLRRAEVFADRKSTRLNSSHGYISYAVF